MTDRMSERDEVTLRTLAYVERTTVAEQRRKAIREYAVRGRRSKQVGELVALILASRQARRQPQPSNVIALRERKATS